MTVLEKIIRNHNVSFQYQQSAISREILSYYCYDLTDPLCFALSFGLGFEYYSDGYSGGDLNVPAPYINGFFSKDRKKLSKHLRIWLDIYRETNFEKGFQMIRKYLDMGRPLIVEFYGPDFLVYLNENHVCNFDEKLQSDSRNFINGYMVNVVGYDDDKKVMYILDSRVKELIMISYELFQYLWLKKDDFIDVEGEWVLLVVPKHRNILDQDLAFIDSVKTSIYEMVNPYTMDEGCHLGLKGLKKFISDFENCSDHVAEEFFLKGLEFSYLNSEVIYKHSGLFRRNYADALKNFLLINREYEFGKSIDNYEWLACKWSEFFSGIKTLVVPGSKSNRLILRDHIELLKQIYDKEKSSIKELSSAIKYNMANLFNYE
jgi:hypothetical protein